MPDLSRDIPEDLQRFAMEVQIYMRDHEDVNELIDGQENGIRLVLLCMAMAISEYNSQPPFIGMVDYSSFPSRSLLLEGTAFHLLQSAQFLLARNSLLYQDGGITVGDVEERFRKYEVLINRLMARWMARVKETKISSNIARALGSGGMPVGVHSEYYWLSGAYGGYG